MFAIPRLAIICGLLHLPHGPLNVERDNSNFPELFRSFKDELKKIRHLLRDLSAAEVNMLEERLLCRAEEPTDLDRRLTQDMAEAVPAEILEDVIKQSSTNPEEEHAEESQSSSHHASRRQRKRQTAVGNRDTRRKCPKNGNDGRARFKSSEDVSHRLFLSISKAADQLQENFAGDFGNIMKYVFDMHASHEEE